MTTALSQNSRAILLLTAPLAFPGETSVEAEPLSGDEYSLLATWLLEMKKSPSALLEPGSGAMLRDVADEIDPERIAALLARGERLGKAVASWDAAGIRVSTRADKSYPKALKSHLREDAPPVVWTFGESEDVLSQKVFSVLGSPSKNKHYDRIGYDNASLAAFAGFSVAATGEEGAGSGALRGALKSQGTAVQVPSKPLAELASGEGWKKLAASGRFFLLSGSDPCLGARTEEEKMANQRLVIALGNAALLVNSGSMETPSWLACEEQLGKFETVPLYFAESAPHQEYMEPLFDMGLLEWPALGGVVDFHQLVAGARKPQGGTDDTGRTKYREAPPGVEAEVAAERLKAGDAGGESPERTEYPELEALVFEVRELAIKRGVPARNILSSVIDALISTGKLDPVVATILEKVSFPQVVS